MTTSRIVILNSYTLTAKRCEEQVRVRSFLDGLNQGGYCARENVEVEFIDSNDQEVLSARLAESLRRPADLIHAVGTPNALLALDAGRDLPVVYYGAHPEGIGREECSRENVCGLVLTLPFTSNYKRYRFVRRLFPEVRRVYVPFYEQTAFCPPAMRAKHRRFRGSSNGSPWVPMDSDQIGFRSLAGLHEIIGLDYLELVYRDADDLARALEQIDPRGSLLQVYNDGVYCHDAPRVVTEYSRESGVPLLWNNNPEATQVGAVAAISGCFREAGLVTGRQAARILDGARPVEVGSQVSSKGYASVNLKRAGELGLEWPEDVLDYFDERIG